MFSRKRDQLIFIRKIEKTSKFEKVQFLFSGFLVGIVMGVLAKLVGFPEITGVLPILNELGGRLGVWIFTGTLLAVFSSSPLVAAFRVFVFALSALFVYHTYALFFLGIYPENQMAFWGLCAVASPLGAFAVWYSNEDGWLASFCGALPVAVMLAEIFLTGKTDWLLQIAYFTMELYLLFTLPKNRSQYKFVLLISIALAAVFIRFQILSMLSGSFGSL